MKEDLDGNQRVPIWPSLKQILKLKKLFKMVINLDGSQFTSICGGGDPAGMFYVPEHSALRPVTLGGICWSRPAARNAADCCRGGPPLLLHPSVKFAAPPIP
jgi:hypothetical protein